MTTASDGYSAPILRDTTGLSGGEPGHVNTTLYTRTITGKDVKAFEWGALHVLDNYSDAGENVALYAQANKHSSGPTWGVCFEACDTNPDSKGSLVTEEVDCWVTGKDNGERFGIDVVLGDSKMMRGLGTSEVVEGTAAIRIGPSNMSPHAKWVAGIDMSGANVDTAIKLAAGQHIQIGNMSISDEGVTLKESILSKAAIALAALALVAQISGRFA